MVHNKQDAWVDYLTGATWAYRMSYHSSIKMTPFEALYGRSAKLPTNLAHYEPPKLKPAIREPLDNYLERIRYTQNEAVQNYRDAQNKIKTRYDKRSTLVSFVPGDKVLMKIMKKGKGTNPKLTSKFQGP